MLYLLFEHPHLSQTLNHLQLKPKACQARAIWQVGYSKHTLIIPHPRFVVVLYLIPLRHLPVLPPPNWSFPLAITSTSITSFLGSVEKTNVPPESSISEPRLLRRTSSPSHKNEIPTDEVK